MWLLGGRQAAFQPTPTPQPHPPSAPFTLPQLQVSIDYNAGLTAALAGLLALEPNCCAATFA